MAIVVTMLTLYMHPKTYNNHEKRKGINQEISGLKDENAYYKY